MTKAFSLFLWENAPSVNTPLGETLLNKVNAALNEVDNRVVSMDTTKANQADLLTAFADVSYDESTGVITFTKKNGATKKIDTKLEKLAINFSYDSTNQRLVITLDDGTIQYVDMKALITELEFIDSDTVLFSVTDGKVTANIAKGSITGEMIDPSYLAEIELHASNAKSSASKAASASTTASVHVSRAKSYAESASGSAELAESYANSANSALEEVNKKLELAEFDIDEDGNLIYTDTSSYNFTVDDNGYLNWEVA